MTKNTSFGSFRRGERGVSLVEAAVILAVISTLTAVLAPAINGYIEQARQARTREDIQTIGEAIQDFVSDNAELMFLQDGNNTNIYSPPTRADANRVDLLVSDGDIPTLQVSTLGTLWTSLVNGTTLDTLANHLVVNTRMTAGVEPKDANKRYRNPSDIDMTTVGTNANPGYARTESSGFNAPYSWRGAYLGGPVGPDPWGNRYAVNVVFLDPSLEAQATGVPAGIAAADYPRMDVFVLSAGADEEVDTAVAQDGAVPGDDDFIHIVSSNAK